MWGLQVFEVQRNENGKFTIKCLHSAPQTSIWSSWMNCFKNLRAEKCMKMQNVHAEIVFLVCFVTFFRIPVLASQVPLYLSPDLFWPFNREEKLLRHVVMVAKFLDDNKPKMSPTKWIRTSLNFIQLIQFYLIWKMLATFSQVESERTVFKFRKRKRQHLCCVHPLHKTSVWN